jgi:hypothetical protein
MDSKNYIPRSLRQRWFSEPTLGIQVVDRRGVLEKHPDQTWLISVERFLFLLA